MTGHLPEWATMHCDDCGEPFLPGFGPVWSSREPDRNTHGGLKYCKAQATWLEEYPDGLATVATLMEQAIVEARELLGRFMADSEDDEWEPVASVVLSAITSLDRGYQARNLLDEPSRDPKDYNAAWLWSLLKPLLPVEVPVSRDKHERGGDR